MIEAGAQPIPAATSPAHAGSDTCSRIPLADQIAAWVILSLALALRCVYTYRYRFNSDESQHLHVVWGWTKGLVQYRDLFDNHTPLFDILLAPVLAFVGERADALFPMRFAMLPLTIATLVLLYKLCASMFSKRTALWAVVFASVWPSLMLHTSFFLKMIEFRTDVLWTLFWIAGLAILVDGPLTARRLFFAGLTFGAAMSTSMKTTLMLVSLALGAGVLACIQARIGNRRAVIKVARSSWAFLAGFCIVPAILLAYFAARHDALRALKYCVIDHNKLPGMHLHLRGRREAIAALCSMAAAIWCIWKVTRDRMTANRRTFLVLSAGIFYLALEGFWPMITFQDCMPFDPLFAACAAPVAVACGDWLGRRFGSPPLRLAPLVAVCAFGLLRIGLGLPGAGWWSRLALENPFENHTSGEVHRVADVLKLTHPDDWIMDAKGETIFRRRAFYYVLEILTEKRIDLGLIEDNVIERLIETRTAVLHQSWLTPRDQDFVDAHYISTGYVSVLGAALPTPENGSIAFDVAIPERYTIVADTGRVRGDLDGLPLDGPRALDPGRHLFTPSASQPAGQRLALFWARAHELGYRPNFADPTPHISH